MQAFSSRSTLTFFFGISWRFSPQNQEIPILVVQWREFGSFNKRESMLGYSFLGPLEFQDKLSR